MKALTVPDPARDHLKGPPDAPIQLLEYGDYECPFCGQIQPIVREIQRRLGDSLCFGFRHFPLANMHPHAEHAAEAAEAAGAQGNFWDMHEILFDNQDSLEDADLAEYAASLRLDADRLIGEVIAGAYAPKIREDFKLGMRGGVNGTPTFFINGERYDGARGFEPLLAAMTERGEQRAENLVG
jgi:protein-disulfide isomerase